MLYFATPSTRQVRDAMRAGLLGMIDTPKQGNRLPDGVAWCADNGCGPRRDGKPGTGYPGDAKFLTWLQARTAAADRCWFTVAPDVPYDAGATLARSLPWLETIRSLGFPAALAAQNGIEHLDIPWNAFDVLFLGGDDAWKLGPIPRRLLDQAHARGKPVHMGRVNTRQRLRYARHIGCDSADGTTIAIAPDENLPKMLAWMREIRHQGVLFGGDAA